MKSVDLHTHSNKSDGTLSPSALVDYAHEKGLGAIALTDHDTVAGLDEAITHAHNLYPDLEVVPGIEFSTEYHGKDVHIVGLFVDHHDPNFKRPLDGFIESRTNRNIKMCEKLTEAGVEVTLDILVSEFPGAVITRAHYAKYMLNHGYVGSMREAFDRYIGDHAKCYVPREMVTPEQAIRLILAGHGVPILAHPILYGLGDTALRDLVSQLKECGLIGIEAVYSTYTVQDERQIKEIAKDYGLLISGGSDFHGDNKPGLDLGVGYGKLFIPDTILEDLRHARRSYCQ